MFPGLPHSSGRSVGRSVGRAGLSRRRRRATEVDKEENKAAAPLLSRRACLPVTNPRKERDRPRQERERGGLVRKWTEIIPAEANNAAPLSCSLSLSAACSLAPSAGGVRISCSRPGGAKAAGREREGGRREDEAAVVPRRPRG